MSRRRRRPPHVLSVMLTGLCTLLVAADALIAAGVNARGRASLPNAPPMDSLTVRRAADLVHRARDAERAASAGAAPSAFLTDPTLADSARRAYLAAAALVPGIANWLELRAVGVTRDATARAALVRALALPAARERAPLVDARARARDGDLTGAANALDVLGRPAEALALRLQAATDPATRASVRAALLALLQTATAAAAGTPPPVHGPVHGPLRGSAESSIAESPRERARTAAMLLDSAFGSSAQAAAPLTPAEELRVARALADARDPGTLRRAAAAFAAAQVVQTPADAFQAAGVLARLGRWRDAATAYARLQDAPAPIGPSAAYARGHALLRAGDGAGARAALRRAADTAPADTAPADTAAAGTAGADTAAVAARFLLAELTADSGRDTDARTDYLQVAREYPTSRWAPIARFRAGVLAFAAGSAREAAADFDAVAQLHDAAPGNASPAALSGVQASGDTAANDSTPDTTATAPRDGAPDATAVAATYWAGRAWAAAGDARQAHARWERTLVLDPASYYAWRAAERLGRPWEPTAQGANGSGSAFAIDPTAEAAGRRAALLERVGLTPEAGYEREYLVRSVGDAPDRLLTAAHALTTEPRPGAGIRLAARAIERGASRTPAVWRLLDPLFYPDALRRAATAAGVDPALAAGVIRQESNFTTDAVSPAGARGLMQLMPDVGRALWRGRGGGAASGTTWSPDLLFVPDVNLTLGMRHLAAGLRGYPDPVYALAAYNAGGARVARWRQQPGTGDPELFVERIPYAETRDYVRIVLRNRALYRALYRL